VIPWLWQIACEASSGSAFRLQPRSSWRWMPYLLTPSRAGQWSQLPVLETAKAAEVLPPRTLMVTADLPSSRLPGSMRHILGANVGPSVGRCGDPAYHCMCSMQVVDITPMKHCLTSITSIRVVQQIHHRSKVCL
jgi:hypothetical protein